MQAQNPETAPAAEAPIDTPATPLTLKDPKKIAQWRAAQRHTQAGLGERLIETHGKRLRFHHHRKVWLRWDGAGWREDVSHSVTRLMVAEIRKLLPVDPQFVLQSETSAAIAGALRLASVQQVNRKTSVRVNEQDLNRYADLVPALNGVIDLRLGTCAKANPKHLFTKTLDVRYDAAARCPIWLKFMADICCGDPQLVQWFKVFLGHCLTGRSDSQIFVWLYGDGGNGKGVLVRVLDRLFAEFAITTPASTFAEQAISDANRASPELAGFAGARLVTASETNSELAVDGAFIRWTTGGDKLKARFLGSNPFEFLPTHKTIVSTNHKPRLKEIGNGMERRVRIVPLKAVFAAAPSYKGPVTPPSFKHESELMAELPGILNWCIEGAKEWYANGADRDALVKAAPCKAIEEETALYIESQCIKRQGAVIKCEDAGPFLERCTTDTRTVVPKGAGTRVRDLYAAHMGWCDEQGLEPLLQNKLGRAVTDMGFELKYSNGGVRPGIALNEEGNRLLAAGIAVQRRRKG